MERRIFFILCLCSISIFAYTEKKAPDWVHIQTPEAKSDTYFYQVFAIDNAESQVIAQELASKKAVKAGIEYKTIWYESKGMALERIDDEYSVGIKLACPAYKEINGGSTTYYFLYQISISGNVSHYDDCDCNSRKIQDAADSQEKNLRQRAIRHIQTRAIPASIVVPGVGQMVKGQYVKGGLMLGGEAIGVAGIIVSFSQVASYNRLIKQDAKHATEYANKKDTWQNVGYGFIGLAAAVYLYSLIDVIVARPTDEAINKKIESLAFTPIYSPIDNSLGIAMSINF